MDNKFVFKPIFRFFVKRLRKIKTSQFFHPMRYTHKIKHHIARPSARMMIIAQNVIFVDPDFNLTSCRHKFPF